MKMRTIFVVMTGACALAGGTPAMAGTKASQVLPAQAQGNGAQAAGKPQSDGLANALKHANENGQKGLENALEHQNKSNGC